MQYFKNFLVILVVLSSSCSNNNNNVLIKLKGEFTSESVLSHIENSDVPHKKVFKEFIAQQRIKHEVYNFTVEQLISGDLYITLAYYNDKDYSSGTLSYYYLDHEFNEIISLKESHWDK